MRLRDREDAFAWLAFTIPGIDTRKGALKFELRKDSPLSAPAPRFALSPAVLAAYSLSQSDDIGFRAIEYYGKLCTREQAVEYKLGYHLAEHRLIFPVFYSDGVLGGLIGRCMLKNCASHERWFNYDEGHFKKGRMLMGAERPIDKDKPLVVVEGPSDAIYLRARGIPNVLALMGCEFSDEQVALLLAYRQPIVPLFDDDTAGRAALAKFKKAVGNQTRLLPFQYPTSAYKEKKADPRQIPEECLPDLVASFGRLRFK
jgi:5S rRNA maturation endonuclease (ribonuclease M5)